MLDQNITTLLAALIGGLLSALGGFLANYYIQSSSDKISKRKEIRNMLEKVYKDTQNIQLIYRQIILNLTEKEKTRESILKISEYLDHIEFLVKFYLSPLTKDFSEYHSKINGLIKKSEWETEVDIVAYFKDNNLEISTEIFCNALINLFNKEGYNYF